MYQKTMLDADMRTCAIRNDLTGEVKFVRCDNEFIAYDFCVNYYHWKEDYITYMCDNPITKPDDVVYTDRAVA